jgi:hypothetical protein
MLDLVADQTILILEVQLVESVDGWKLHQHVGVVVLLIQQ